MSRKPVEFQDFPLSVDFGPYRAVIRHWVDGDTCDVLLDLGLHQYAYETLRIRDIDTPEIYGTKEYDGELADGHAAREYAMEIAPVGSPVIVLTHKDKQTFGRYVADLMLADGSDFATRMIAAGHAKWSV